MSARVMLTGAIAAAALLAVPPFLAPGMQGVLGSVLIAALFALAFNLLAGQGGMLSFGHAAYFGAGCFATLHLMLAVENGALALPTPLLPLAGGLAGLALGLVVGYFAALRTGVYFSMVTLAFAELIHSLAPNLPDLLGGESGLNSMRMPWLGISFGTAIEVYYLVLAWTAVCAGLLYAYSRTLFGRLTIAVRDNESRVRFLGFSVHATKVAIFAVSAFFSGIAGGLLAISTESANYAVFGLHYSSAVVLQTFIGGASFFLGPAIGAAVLTLFGHLASDYTRLWLFYQGLCFVAIMMYLPGGLVSLVALARRPLDSWLDAGRLVRAAGVVLMAGGVVTLTEIVAALRSDPLASAGLDTIRVLGLDWSTRSPWSLAVPALAILAGAALAARAVPFAPRTRPAPAEEAAR